MSPSLAIPFLRGVVLAQSAWDRFFEDALTQFAHPNPNLNRDLALDKTIRAMGQRPRQPLTAEECADLEVRAQIEQLITVSIRPNGLRLCDLYDGLEAEPANSPQVEDICDAFDDCEAIDR